MLERASARLLLVDDDELFCAAISDLLATIDIEVVCASSLARARRVAASGFEFVVLDDRLPDGRGLDLLDLLDLPTTLGRRPRIIVVSAEPDIAMAIAALRHKVVDFLTKPIDVDALLSVVRIERPPVQAVADLGERGELDEQLQRYAASDAPLLLRGETGTGKTRLARQLHAASTRATRPFVTVNCAALPESLIESELFGSERGAFTGAATARAGLIESAGGGSFFLDEIGELPLSCQAKLLDVLETHTVRRVGSVRSREIDVRFIAATHVDLERAAERGDFRRDLLYRLDVLRIELPPLRQQPQRLGGFVDELLAELGVARTLADGELERLRAHGWPGNFRELRNLLQRAAIIQPQGPLAPTQLLDARVDAALEHPRPASSMAEIPPTIEELALTHMIDIVSRSRSRKQAAEALGIGESTLRRKLRHASQLGLLPARGRSM